MLWGHCAKPNPQWRHLQARPRAVATFLGPHAYMSPSVYADLTRVPTWNYLAVHAYGALQLVEDREGLHDILTRLVSVYERGMPEPWSYDESDPDIDMMLKAIVGFRIELSRLEGKAKLNQNHPEERRRKVIRALEAQTDDDSRAIARLMTATLKE